LGIDPEAVHATCKAEELLRRTETLSCLWKIDIAAFNGATKHLGYSPVFSMARVLRHFCGTGVLDLHMGPPVWYVAGQDEPKTDEL
jgi:hypothetical protein